MTNKEAAEILRGMKSDFQLPKAAQTRRAQNDALDAAIKALKAESCDDAISRQAAIDENVRYCFKHDDDILWQDDDFCSRAERRTDD